MSDVATAYILANFEPTDNLAVVLLNKRTDSVIQRLATADKIAAPDFQAWLKRENEQGYEVYVSMNALAADAKGRTKQDIATIRHLYLDLDEDGAAKLEALLRREDLPKPNYLLQTSPGKWQVVWKVAGFGKDQAERLQRGLARETGADPAATDCSRVLRVPGFRNHKYAGRPIVRVQALSNEIHRPERFPNYRDQDGRDIAPHTGRASGPQRERGQITQSERDWAYAKRALSRGERPDLVVAAIANHRRYDKYAPLQYAELTVRKAAEAFRAEELPQPAYSHRRMSLKSRFLFSRKMSLKAGAKRSASGSPFFGFGLG